MKKYPFSTTHNFTHPRRQGGAILFVSIVILLVIAMLASASLSSTVMQQRMAINTQAETLAFNASESAVNAAAENVNLLLHSVDTSGVGNPLCSPIAEVCGDAVLRNICVRVCPDLSDARVISSATVIHRGIGTASGFSLGVDGGSFGAYRFEVQGAGIVTSLNIQSNTTQGLYKIAPSG